MHHVLSWLILFSSVGAFSQSNLVPVKVLSVPCIELLFLKPDTMQEKVHIVIGDRYRIRVFLPILDSNKLIEIANASVPYGVTVKGYNRYSDTIRTYGRFLGLGEAARYWSYYKFVYPDSLKLLFTLAGFDHGGGYLYDDLFYYASNSISSKSGDSVYVGKSPWAPPPDSQKVDSAYKVQNPWIVPLISKLTVQGNYPNKYVNGRDSIFLQSTGEVRWNELQEPPTSIVRPKVEPVKTELRFLRQFNLLGRREN